MLNRTGGGILTGMRVVEASAFVAAPLGGALLAGMGADVIRFDPISGGIDHDRWPVTPNGFSFYWAGLNQGKRSIALDTSSEEGREIALSLASAPGDEGGIALTNYPAESWFGFDTLRDRRSDIIVCIIEGHADGRPAVDYTINAATGLPLATGPEGIVGPINSVLPVWDVVTGSLAVVALLAADRARRISGSGTRVQIALADVANAVVAHLGFVGEAAILGRNRPRLGNHLYGAFGRDFETKDGKRIMIVAITAGQIHRLGEALSIEVEIAALESDRGYPIESHGDLFKVRHELAAMVQDWVGSRDFDEVEMVFDSYRVLWGPYQDFVELSTGAGRWSVAANRFSRVEHPGVGAYPIPHTPFRFTGMLDEAPIRAPRLGEHTDEVLEDLLGLSPQEIGRLHGRRVVSNGH